jgi:Tol biopolymer transport system component
MSADGRFVVFESDASNLVAGDTNARRDIFVYDRAARLLTRESLDPGGVESNATSYTPSISDDGRYVAFMSTSGNLVIDDTNQCPDVFGSPPPGRFLFRRRPHVLGDNSFG